MAKPDVCGRTSADGETSSWGLQPQSEKYSPSRDTQEIHSLGLFAVITSQSWLLIAVLIICVESSNLSPSLLPVELCKTATFLSWTSCCKISAISVTSCDYNAFQKTQQTLQCHTQTQQPMEGRNRLRNGQVRSHVRAWDLTTFISPEFDVSAPGCTQDYLCERVSSSWNVVEFVCFPWNKEGQRVHAHTRIRTLAFSSTEGSR